MKRKINYNYWYGFATSIFIIFLLGFIVFFVYPKIQDGINGEVPKDLETIINECSNRTLIESVECVRDITETFFKYNVSNIEKDIGFETLKKEGGMCESWADYWCEIGDELGYYTKKVQIDTGSANFTYKGVYREWLTNHAFCVWSDNSSYIIADGIEIQGYKFRNSFYEELE